MAFQHGIKATLSVNSVDITGYLESVSPTFSRELAELRNLGAGSVKRLAGLRDCTFTADGDLDPTVDAALWAAYDSDTPVPVIFSPDEDVTTYTVDMFLNQYSPNSASNAAGKFSISLSGSGDVVRATS
jgi:hypothetical protein